MAFNAHNAIRHPFKGLKWGSDRFMDWVANVALPSPVMFYTALIAPLIVIPMSETVKTFLMIIASNWIQWWALPALQRRQNELDAKMELKADSDHEALTHLANKLDRLESIILHPSLNQKAAE